MEDEFYEQCNRDVAYLEKICELYRASNNTEEVIRVCGKIEGIRLARDKYVSIQTLKQSKRSKK